MMRQIISFCGILVAATILSIWAGASAFAQSAPEAPAVEAVPGAESPALVFPKTGPFNPEKIAIPQADMIAAWSRSGHADMSAEAFNHWNAEGEVPESCAKCHSGAGFRSFHGLDGSTVGKVDHPVPIGGVVDCETCHNPKLSSVAEIQFPSGATYPVKGVEAACMTCHQGRESGVDVAEATNNLEEDAVSADLRFINPHYYLAAANFLGSIAQPGYQYDDKTYSARFPHAKPIATCVSCHNPHTLEINEEPCLTCHTTSNPDDIRITHASFDGSGDLTKGIKSDIAANAETLMAAIREYSEKVVGTPIVYASSYPYFFADTDLDGQPDKTAEGKTVSYASWTPRLLKAAYNWKVVTADPGVHAHNPYYALELLYDSVENLAAAEGMDIDMGGMLR